MSISERQSPSPSPPGKAPDGSASARPIVAFDFDGTLTTHDSFMSFLRWRGGLGHLVRLIRLVPAALAYLRHRDRGRLKAAAVRVCLKGVPRAQLEQEAGEFAARFAPRLLRPDALTAWRRYRTAGARLVIVTASPDILVAPFARGLGADLLIGTRLAFDRLDRVQGGFEGENCRGPEKVRRLQAAFGADVRVQAAYGDTAGDAEMLAMADQGFMKVFTARPSTGG
jgi:phosphatidylglycerophosphatase C